MAAPRGSRPRKHFLRLTGKQVPYNKGEEILVDFTPLRKSKKIQRREILPTFNRDSKHYTSSFILPAYQRNVSDEEALEDHRKRIQEAITQIDEHQIMVPRPKRKNKYCSICKNYYEEYLDHLDASVHVQRIRSSQFQKYINQLCEKWNQGHEKQQNTEEQSHPTQFTSEELWENPREQRFDDPGIELL